MYILHEEPKQFAQLNERFRNLSYAIASVAPVARQGFKIPAGKSVLELPETAGALLFLREGALQYSWDGQVQFLYEQGDLAGAELQCPGIQAGSLASDFAVVVDVVDREAMYQFLAGDQDAFRLWNEFLSVQLAVFSLLAASFQREDVVFEPNFHSYEAGATIIEEGTAGTDVYTLAEGGAEVFVEGVRVGQVLPDEIFGVIAALTDTPRTATVIAREPSLVMTLPREQFKDLIRSRPGTVQKLVEDLARQMVALNDRVVDLTQTQGDNHR